MKHRPSEFLESTLRKSLDAKHTGVATCVNDRGNVVLMQLVDGEIVWGQEIDPEQAEQLGAALIAKANEARKVKPS